jgi:CDP-diacylglycerol--glycerol-3-phosphate 3-phosphatidyltransferase
MTTANKVTIGRILLVPFFIFEVLEYIGGGGEIHRHLALAAFALASISDGIDGFIARRFRQRSELGAVLDPLADKLLLLSGIVLLSLHREAFLPHLPMWLTATVISRDVLLLLGWGVIHHFVGRTEVRPHWVGKVATVLQMICVLWALLKFRQDWLTIWAAAAASCTAISGVIYIYAGVRQLGHSPASSPAPRQ